MPVFANGHRGDGAERITPGFDIRDVEIGEDRPIVSWRFRALIDPTQERVDLIRGELWLPAGRHVRLGLFCDDLGQQRLSAIPGLDGCPVFAALHQKLKCLDGEFSFEIVVVVATDTVLAKDGRDVAMKINRFGKGRDGKG